MDSQNALEDIKVNLKFKLASIWTSLMFLIIYLDYFHLYMPGSLSDMLSGKVFVFEITQVFLLAALAMVALPALMIFFSLTLPAQLNRWANIVVACINIPLILFNLAGEAWVHMVVGAVIQVILLGIIIYISWKWPRITN
ncbi:MAG: DUF6326 family protein [Spirosomaceae bacterium]|nr:DUF6326 family protein [Spirosomataceae bacterium]